MRLKIRVKGTVQGVGFRPFVYRLAKSLGLKGFVLNDTLGVLIEVEGAKKRLDEFLVRLEKEKPPVSRIYSLEFKFLPDKGYSEFEIRKSQNAKGTEALILPDLAVCRDCIRELNDPKDRRYRYPFINCTNCGPRFTIIEKLPYDRKNTTMKKFKMCPECQREYEDPTNRRFHAQPNACPKCGPKVWIQDAQGRVLATEEEAIRLAESLIKEGKILAVKGLGGFHLICDASNNEAVKKLRIRKNREEKPFAVMFPDLSSVKSQAEVSKIEERTLESVEKPIVILKKKENFSLSEQLAPKNKTVGVFLPYTPLHYILLNDLKKPVVATSANVTDEPIVKDNDEALRRLKGIADYFLVNDRPIKRRCDDSVVTIMRGKIVPVRRSRGYAPLPLELAFELKNTVLAVGPFMKNTVAVGKRNLIFLSQHVGDLETAKACEFFESTVRDMLELFNVEPEVVVCDLHPSYYSSKFAEKIFGEKLIKVQHHFAHTLSCMAENEVPIGQKVISFAFDGTGYGDDRTIWGGEVFIADYFKYERVFHLKKFRLPGSEKAVKEPFRTAISLLEQTGIEPETLLNVDRKKISFIKQMLQKSVNCPETSSMGRLFDAVSAMCSLVLKASYHAQAAIILEQAALESKCRESYRFEVDSDGNIDWRAVISEIANDLKRGVWVADVAKKFHNAVSTLILELSLLLRDKTGINSVVLTGGVFQNRLLTETTGKLLEKNGFEVLTHQLVPPNDGGISLGQAVYGGLVGKA